MGSGPLHNQLQIVSTIQAARATGAHIHDLSLPAKELLAREGEYTTVHHRDPGDFDAYREHMGAVRMLGVLATNATRVLRHVPGYEDAGDELGTRLASSCSKVIAIHSEGVRTDPEVGLHKVVTDRTIYTVPTMHDAEMLAGPLQAMLIPMNLDYPRPVFMGSRAGRPTVEVCNMSEFDIRVMGSAVTELLIQEFAAKFGVNLRLPKRRLPVWLAGNDEMPAETFPPLLLAWLQANANDYHRLMPYLTATYPDYPRLRPRISPHALATEPAAMFEGTRKNKNGLIHRLRRGSHRNKEQDDNEEARLRMEENVDIRRDPIEEGQDWGGPNNPRAAYTREHALEASERAMEEARQRPGRAVATLAIKGVGLGVEAVAELALTHLPGVTRAGKQYIADRKAWRRLQELADADARKVDAAVARILSR